MNDVMIRANNSNKNSLYHRHNFTWYCTTTLPIKTSFIASRPSRVLVCTYYNREPGRDLLDVQ